MAQFPAYAGKQHRTALVVDLTAHPGGVFLERADRLIESLNGDQIKTDVYIARNGGVSVDRVGNDTRLSHGEVDGVATRLDLDEIRFYLSKEGYDQILVSLPPVV